MPQPLAIWNSARDAWETPGTEGLFCEHLDVFSETFPTSGMTLNGVAYELPTWEPATDVSASSSLLPTVTTSESTGPGKGPNKTGGDNLRTMVSLLPTVTARDWKSGGTPGSYLERAETIAQPLSEIRNLLPTPTVGMMLGGSETRSGARNGEKLLPGVAKDLALLPTPVASPSGNTPENHLRKKPGRVVVTDLAILVENDMLETGGKLLPTPAAMDGSGGRITKEKGGFRESGAKRSITLSTAVHHDLTPPTGETTPQPLPAGNQLWEDVPLPLLNQPDATADTD